MSRGPNDPKSLADRKKGPPAYALGLPGPSPMMASIRQETGSEKPAITGRTVLAIAGAVATAALIALTAYGIKVGFNSSPRGPKPLIVLKDRDADRSLTCLRELAHDAANGALFNNKWADENCPPGMVRSIETADNPLAAAVSARRTLFAAVGIPPMTERWEIDNQGSAGPETVFSLDSDQLAEARTTGAIESTDPDAIVRDDIP